MAPIAQSKLTAQGQVSVPAEVRRRLGVGPGAILEWDAEGGAIVVRRAGRYSSEDVQRAVVPKVRVRLLTRDDSRQVATAEAFVAGGAWVSHVVLVETVWVLTAVYELGAASIATAVEMLLNHQHLTLQDTGVVAAALVR